MSGKEPLTPNEEEEHFTDKFGKFCSESSVFALTRIYNGSRVQRMIWASMLLFMLGMFCYQMTNIFRTYYSYPSEIEVKTFLAPSLPFPAVTVCNLNPARKSVAMKWNWTQTLKIEDFEKEEDDLYEMLIEGMMEKNPNMTWEDLTDDLVEEYMEEQEEEFNKWDLLEDMDKKEKPDGKAGYYDTMETTAFVMSTYQQLAGKLKIPKRFALAHRKNELIVSCQWMGYQCSPKNFTTFLDPRYGVCHTFNSGRLGPNRTKLNDVLTVSGSGSHYSLQVELNIQQFEYINTLSPNAGIRVQIHQPDRMPFPADEGFNIPPKYLTSVGIKLNRYTHLPPKWGDCEPSVNKETLYSQFGANYSIQACLKTCLVDAVFLHCDCAMLGYPDPLNATDDTKMCRMIGNNTESATPGKDLFCVKQQVQKSLKGSCDCPRPCQDDVYTLLTSYSLYPSDAYEKVLEKKLKESSKEMRKGDFDAADNIAKLEVYFQDMQYVETKASKSYEEEKLLSDLGGMLGLWLGFSIITMAEFGEFFLQAIKTMAKKCFKKKNQWPSMSNLSKLKAKQIKVQPTMGLNNIADLDKLSGTAKAKKAALA